MAYDLGKNTQVNTCRDTTDHFQGGPMQDLALTLLMLMLCGLAHAYVYGCALVKGRRP
jgi:hypothetical protein